MSGFSAARISFVLLLAPSLPAQELSFTVSDYPSGSFPFSVAAGDLNGDQLNDLCVASFSGSRVDLYLGIGEGMFESVGSVAVDRGPREVMIRDANRDGAADIFVSCESSGSVFVLHGTGTGLPTGFTPMRIPLFSGPRSFALEDLDDDGFLDFVVSQQSAGNVMRMLGQPGPSFGSSATFDVGVQPYNLVQGNFNGDDFLDLAVANRASATVTILLGSIGASFIPTGADLPSLEPYAITGGDVNADGHMDLILGNYDQRAIEVYLGQGGGEFTRGPSFDGGEWITSLITLELDGDGRLDLVSLDITRSWSSQFGTISFHLGRGDGTFVLADQMTIGISPFRVVAEDLDGDGVSDLALVNSRSNNMQVLINDSYERAAPRSGTVNAGAGAITDVLFLNGLAGTGDERRVEYDVLAPFELRMRRPPTVPFPEVAPYVVYLWPGEPTEDQVSPLPLGMGRSAMPMPISGGVMPPVVWNNAGRRNRLGIPNRPSAPAPGAFYSTDQLRQVGKFYVQGIIFDPGSSGAVPASVTNGLVGVPVIR